MKLVQQPLTGDKIVPRLVQSNYDPTSTVGRTSEAAAKVVGRYELISIGAARIRELRSGHARKVPSTYGDLVTVLLEIEAGKIDAAEYLLKSTAVSKRSRQ
jgi:hypothetical protein